MPHLLVVGCLLALVAVTIASGEPYPVSTEQHLLRDPARDRPVWVDVWRPAPEAAAGREPTAFPVVLLSHGAMGSARSHSRFAQSLAAHGYVVVGASHYGESWVYGPQTLDPSAVLRLWD